jgi:hypothetical protein
MNGQTLSTSGPALTPDESSLIQGALNGETQPQWNIYWSRVRFTSVVSAAPFVYSIASGTKVSAFSYAQGQSGSAAGLQANATNADTSLQIANQTINSEYALIRGVGIFLGPGSDPVLAKQLDGVVSVTAVLGPVTYQLGNPSMIPGPGGYVGTTESQAAYPNPLESYAMRIGGFSNGLAMAGNVLKLPRAWVWMPSGSGSASNLVINLTSQASAAIPANFAGAADRPAEPQTVTFTGTNPWTHPTAANVFVDYIVVLDHVPFYTGG